MSDLFRFDNSFTKDEATQAIFNLELKNWTKAQQAAAKEQREFTDPKPELDAIRERFSSLSAGEALVSYATDGRQTSISAEGPVLSEAEAKKFGAAFIRVEKDNEAPGRPHPVVHTTGSDGKEYTVEGKELSAWLQGNARAGKNIPVNEWATVAEVGLTAHGDTIKNGDEELYIETREGQRRTVSNGIITTPITGGHYGAIKGTKSADGDDLDIYISSSAHKDISGGNKYGDDKEERIFLMQMMEDGKPEELKVGYVKSATEFKSILTSTFAKPEDFEKQYEGKYVEISHDQYAKLKEVMKENPALTLEEFAKDQKLETKTFPTLEEMKAAGEKAKAGETKEEGEKKLREDPHKDMPAQTAPYSVFQQAAAAVRDMVAMHKQGGVEISNASVVAPNPVSGAFSTVKEVIPG